MMDDSNNRKDESIVEEDGKLNHRSEEGDGKMNQDDDDDLSYNYEVVGQQDSGDGNISKITSSASYDGIESKPDETNTVDDYSDLDQDPAEKSLHLKFVADDNEDEDDDDDNSTYELLRKASAKAIEDAAVMKSSDSVLSGLNLDAGSSDSTSADGTDSHNNNIESQRSFHHNNRLYSTASIRYMEEASFEAAMLSPNHHRLSPSGRAGRARSNESNGMIDFKLKETTDESTIGEESVNEDVHETYLLGQIDGGSFSNSDQPVSTETNSNNLTETNSNNILAVRPPLETVHSVDALEEEGDNKDTNNNNNNTGGGITQYDLFEVLKSVGLHFSENESYSSSSFPQDVILLHELFREVSNPPLEIQSVDLIMKMERGEECMNAFVDLPTDVVIHKPSDALTRLIGPTLLRLPKDFAMTLFRILIRLLTNDNDVEYNHEILKWCTWYDETFSLLPPNSSPQLQRQRTSSLSSVKKRRPSFSGINRTAEARKADQLYNLVRFQRSWNNGVRELLNLLEAIVGKKDATTTITTHFDYLLPPATRLLGLLCTSSVSVDELRRILSLASNGEISPKTRLLLVKALNVAATGAARSSRLVGKASPRNFFSFASGAGITRSISLEKTKWPFKNDFGIALWFRAEHFDGGKPPTLLRVVNDKGSGIEISLSRLPSGNTEDDSSSPPATVLAISILESGKMIDCTKVSKCVLHARVWYHVAIRHTRSRLKGVFSLKAREQISVMLDGKQMLSESLTFPQVQNSKTMTFTFGETFDGQTGSLYVFHENVSDATLNALYGLTAGTNGVVHRRDSVHDEWDSRRGDIAKKSKVLDLHMRRDDVDDIVLSQRADNKESSLAGVSVVDLDEEDETFENAPLSKTAFNSRLCLVWHPQRTESDVALELHCGAHARMDPNVVRPWAIQNVQDVIGSLGGVQALLPVYRSLLDGSVEKDWPVIENSDIQKHSSSVFEDVILCSIIPSLLSMLSSFVRNNGENAREMLRCGGIDIIEQLLYTNKNLGSTVVRFPADSLMASLSIFPALASRFIDSLLELRAACSHYIGLESKVFSRILFNMPLWFGEHKHGIFLFHSLLPVLSSITCNNPEKVRDCVGINDMVHLATELVEFKDVNEPREYEELFARESRSLEQLRTALTREERRNVVDVLLGMIFQILGAGSTIEGVSQFLHLLSRYLETEWEEASNKAKNSSNDSPHDNSKVLLEERQKFSLKACTCFYFLLQARPYAPNFIEAFASACGSVQGGAAWILSSMVNSYSDGVRSLGVRCIVCYLERTASSPDQSLSLSGFELEKARPLESRTIQENTMSLISNVGQGFLNSNVGKGLAAIGQDVRSKLLSPSKLTARVVYKLMWHLLKFHRYRMSQWTQSSLFGMVVDPCDDPLNRSIDRIKERLVIADDTAPKCAKFHMAWATSKLSDVSIGPKTIIRDSLGVSTVLRLLRFLPEKYLIQWLENLVNLSNRKVSNAEALSSCADWQSCLFQLLSEIVEKVSASCSGGSAPAPPNGDSGEKDTHHEDANHPSLDVQCRKLDLALDLYATLLAHRFREGGDKALAAIEDCASLQRVCLNGQEVFIFILSRLFADLSRKGVVSLDDSLNTRADAKADDPTFLLKRSATLVTNAILSNGTGGMDLSKAVGCWRGLRHLTAITVASVTRLGSQTASAVDELSGGLHGIRLTDGDLAGISARELCHLYAKSGPPSSESGPARVIFRSVSVTVAAQILSLLDVFVFPDSLDASLPASQLHGLALVRSTETRIGSAQGPLLTSLIRLSLILLCHLEPCSVKLLQCSSRLRCFLHWILELIRESEALEGYSAAFNKITAPFDRLVLAIVLQCHRTLGRSGALLSEIESSPFENYFSSKDAQKKSYRRLLRVALELRDILVTIYDRRNEVLQASLSSQAYECVEIALTATQSPSAEPGSPVKSSQKEILVRALLSSDWVTKFQDVEIRDGLPLPEQLKTVDPTILQGAATMNELRLQSSDIVDSLEKALNVHFEKYLESQRQWAETGAVRDLEFEGDTTLRRLAGRQALDASGLSRKLASRSAAVEVRWKGIERKVLDLWIEGLHWKLARYTDRIGRRIVLVLNRQFDDHNQASYDLMMGMEREKEERDREERMRKKKELEELMKRNTDAFNPQGETDENDEAFKETEENELEANGEAPDESKSVEESVFDQSDTFAKENGDESTPDVTPTPAGDEDIDAWAKSFIWSDNESVVARFDSVMVVTLQYVVEGKLLLTTHGLYFHREGEEVNCVTREPLAKSAQSNLEDSDRRWRLSRLTEVHGRRFMLRGQALELFFSGGHELFLNFLDGSKQRNRFYAKLRNSCKVPMLFSPKSLNPREILRKSNLTELWKKRKLSNFEYLMALNRIAGRTFNDIAQYPVFPWVLSDYSSEKIDLRDSRIYRDLSKPVGALNPNRLAQLLERYNELEQFGFSENERFLYGSHYSSPGVVLHYLIRQEPFTSMAIDLQSGRFDCPDRLFFDLTESWKSCNTSSSDVKELIPEFFTLPEMFLNSNKFPLGRTQRGRVVDDVCLPPWAKGSAYEFVRMNRLALESEHVSRNLHHWIDLIFGFKQRGPEAEAAHNIFHHLSYEGSVDLDKISDEVDRNAAESHIQNFGQTPSQLITKEPHPSRLSADECWIPLINNMSSTVRLRCHTPSKQYGGKKFGAGSVARIYVQADSITAVYSDLKVGTFKWSPRSPNNRLKPDKLRSLPNRGVSNSRSVIKRGSAAPQTMNDSNSRLAVGNWSFALTIGGYEKEQLRRKSLMPSRLVSAKDALYLDASPMIVSCGYWDNNIKVHSMDAWRVECSENGGHRGPIRCIAVGEHGGLMVSGGEDCTCRVWVVDHPDMAIALSDGYVQTALGQSTDSDQILSCVHVLWGHETPITCVDLSSDLDITVSGSVGGRVCVHTVRTGTYVRSIFPLPNKDVSVDKLVLDSHGRMVVHMNDGSLHLYTVNGHLICSADAGERIHDMKISGEVLITGGDRCHVYIRDLKTLRVLSGLDLSRHGPIRCISLTPDELNPVPQNLFIGSDDGYISIVDRDEDF